MKVSEISELLSAGNLSSAEIVKSAVNKALSDRLGCFISVTDTDKAMKQAAASDIRRRSGKQLSPLDGIPIAVKDNILVSGEKNTCGSSMLENFIPPYDAACVTMLRQAGCIIIGKTNMDEFGMGSSTENSAFFPTKNPTDNERVPGGSSGGSAAAVAAGYLPLALGSDTGGSVRQPAAFCGVTGLKPTYGAVSRYGLTAFASSLDTVGIIAEDPRGCGIAAKIIYGRDPRDSTSHDIIGGKTDLPRRFAVPEELLRYAGSDISDTVEKAADALTEAGLERVSLSLPSLKYALASYYIISSAEASSNLARFDGVRFGKRTKFAASSADELISLSREDGLGHEVKRRILIGSYALSEGQRDNWYGRAMTAKRMITDEMESALERCDMILAPVSPSLPWKTGETPKDPSERYKADIMTVPASLAGLPAVSVPFGRCGNLPVGVQLIGKKDSDEALIETAGILYTACG